MTYLVLEAQSQGLQPRLGLGRASFPCAGRPQLASDVSIKSIKISIKIYPAILSYLVGS